MKKLGGLMLAVLLAGCSAYSSKPTTTVLPTSGRSIDVVLHRGDVRLMDCATLVVIQTYSEAGQLIDAKEARGSALHCVVLPALVEAGGRVGAGAVGASRTTIRNSNQQGQSQVSNNSNSNTNTGGGGGGYGGGGEGGHGNNGGGNGDGDGTNNGTDNHHDNGDND